MTNIAFARKAKSRAGLGAVAFCLTLACATAFAQTTPDSAQGTSAQNSIKLVNVLMALPAGTPWLTYNTEYIFCGRSAVKTWDGSRQPQEPAPYATVLKAELEQAGFKVAAPEENLFDREAGSADLEVAAVITDEHLDVCVAAGGMFTKEGEIKGSATMKVDWQVYSPIKKQIVARISTNGSAKVDNYESGGYERLITESFAANAAQLAKAADFRTAMNAPKALTKGFVMPGQQSRIALAGSLKAKGRPIADAVGSVVTILAGDSSGSGVLVSDDGYLLTNAHVVGDEKTVRVRWSDNIETLGQVVRVAKDRDVAIIKTNARERTPFAIKRGTVTPGQKVFAIGSPKGEKFQGTVTSGIVSTATRIVDGLRYIQSDTMVSFGSSGGALLDESGSLIGLTDLGFTNAGMPAGLNLFIPIGDAMDFLSLDPQ
jgi:serine protease Do